MALSDAPTLINKRSPKRRAIDSPRGTPWSDGQKLEAVQTYLMLGSVRMTSAALKIPEITLKVWRATAWWKDLEAELKIQDELQLSTRLKKIAEKSFAVVEDRLENGNFIFDQKTGKIRRIPVSLKDAHKVAVDSVVQKDMIGKRHVDTANDGQIINKLEQLALKFAEMASQKFNENRTVEMADVVEKDDDDAVYDQREAGLQEGESAVQLEAERAQETQ